MINYNIIPNTNHIHIGTYNSIKILKNNFYTAGPTTIVFLIMMKNYYGVFFSPSVRFTVIISRVSAFIIQRKLRRFCRSTVFTSISRS